MAFPTSTKNSSSSLPLIIFLCMVVNCLILLPTLFVQDTLTAGDVGDNLYCFQAVIRGQIPYHDFVWFYGPAMLYYNALFFKIFGTTIHSVMLGRLFLKTIFSAVFLLAARRIMPLTASFLATIALSIFMHEFPNNFSHYGGVCMEIGILWAVLSYYQTSAKRYLWGAGLFILLLGFCKINFGVLSLGGVIACFILIDLFKHKSWKGSSFIKYGILSLSVLLIWAVVYYSLVRGLSLHEINQCFPFFNGYMYYGGTLSSNLASLLKRILDNIQQDPFDGILAIVILMASFRIMFHTTWNHSCLTKNGRNFPLIMVVLLILMAVSYHEYIKGATDYQSYWAHPFNIMTIAYLISEASIVSGSLIYGIVFLICLYSGWVYGYQNWKFYKQYMNQDHFFSHKKINVYVNNDPQDIKTVLKTEEYIEKNIPPHEPFFAFPADALFYYLADRAAPNRIIYILGVSRITPEQEIEIVNDLEKRGVEYIIVDNVCYFGNMWGVFGADNCILLNKYIKKYFHEAASIDTSPRYAWVGMEIFKKNDHEKRKFMSPKDLN